MKKNSIILFSVLLLLLLVSVYFSRKDDAKVIEDGIHPITTDTTKGWKLLREENFKEPFDTDEYEWIKEPKNEESPWYYDDLDSFGKAWAGISDPYFSENIETFDVFRKRISFGEDNWLTAEVAAVDKDKDGKPDSNPRFVTKEQDGHSVGYFDEPKWDAGILIRSTDSLPEQYRIEVKLRSLNFGGKRDDTFYYDNKYNGYSDYDDCVTNFPWTFRGSLDIEEDGVTRNRKRCEYSPITNRNGFYYLTILDHYNPNPQGNVGIHYRRKVIMDGYYLDGGELATCNPKSGQLYHSIEGNTVGVNAIFPLGGKDAFGLPYEFKNACGEFSTVEKDIFDEKITTPEGKPLAGIMSSAELNLESLEKPDSYYTFAIERHKDSYTVEYSGDFQHIGEATFRYSRKFVENDVPIWHYNQTAQEYDGRYNQDMTIKGPTGSYTKKDTWPAGSAYPDTFIIGDPHINFYEGTASIDEIRLFVPK